MLSQIFDILFRFSYILGPLTHTKDEITTVYGIVHGPGSFPECAATAIFTKVSGNIAINEMHLEINNERTHHQDNATSSFSTSQEKSYHSSCYVQVLQVSTQHDFK